MTLQKAILILSLALATTVNAEPGNEAGMGLPTQKDSGNEASTHGDRKEHRNDDNRDRGGHRHEGRHEDRNRHEDRRHDGDRNRDRDRDRDHRGPDRDRHHDRDHRNHDRDRDHRNDRHEPPRRSDYDRYGNLPYGGERPEHRPSYPSYPNYPTYPTYPTYPADPTYPSYPSYPPSYPSYPSHPEQIVVKRIEFNQWVQSQTYSLKALAGIEGQYPGYILDQVIVDTAGANLTGTILLYLNSDVLDSASYSSGHVVLTPRYQVDVQDYYSQIYLQVSGQSYIRSVELRLRSRY